VGAFALLTWGPGSGPPKGTATARGVAKVAVVCVITALLRLHDPPMRAAPPLPLAQLLLAAQVPAKGFLRGFTLTAR